MMTLIVFDWYDDGPETPHAPSSPRPPHELYKSIYQPTNQPTGTLLNELLEEYPGPYALSNMIPHPSSLLLRDLSDRF